MKKCIPRAWLPLAVGLGLLPGAAATSTGGEPPRPLLLANYYACYHDGNHPDHPWAGWTRKESEKCFGFYSTFSNFRAHRYEELAGKYRHLAAQAHGSGKKMLLPVHPGHDNSHFRDDPYVMPRRDGQTLRDYLRAATDAGADFIMVTSWNEWPETTVIEPSSSWPDPYHYLRILAEWKGKGFHTPPLPVGIEETSKVGSHDELVAATHKASLEARERVLRTTVSRDSCWPHGAWGDTMWALAALTLNEKVEEANARLLKRANAYVALKRGGAAGPKFTPEETKATPWAYFALTDYVRILCLFHAKSTHYPGRLRPETEAAMKEALWFWVKQDSKLALASPDHLLVLLGTENHDLTRRPNHYLVASLLKDDPAYRDRSFDDGHTAAEHAAAYETFLREWPRKRAMTGLWFEVGSNTYQKYSWPALFNLHELAPDPVIRKRFGLLLDLAFIEEAQISVRGRRGGGRSRAGGGRTGFESYKNLLYAPQGAPAGSSHSKVIETSHYQLPAAAIWLRKREFPSTKPFVIRNRVLGELEASHPADGEGRRHAADSALVNYAWRTPHYLLGSTLQDPSLDMPDPENGGPVLKYAGISRQNRWCGMLFDDPENGEICAVYPVIEKTRGGRPQHPHWSVQHENVLLLQRIARQSEDRIGSYSTGRISIRFHGRDLAKTEQGGWIFASNGKAFVGVKFLDGGHAWDETREVAGPVGFKGASDKSRILLHAGDITTHKSFEQFRAGLLDNPVGLGPEKVDYRFGSPETRIEATIFDGDHPDRFVLPRVNGKPTDLRPSMSYQSPYLNGAFGSDRIDVTVGPVKRVIDFGR